MTYQVPKYPSLSYTPIQGSFRSLHSTKHSQTNLSGKYKPLVKAESSCSLSSKQKKTLAIAMVIGTGIGLLLIGGYCALMASGSLAGKAIASSLPSASMVCGSIALMVLGIYTLKKGYQILTHFQFGNQFYRPHIAPN